MSARFSRQDDPLAPQPNEGVRRATRTARMRLAEARAHLAAVENRAASCVTMLYPAKPPATCAACRAAKYGCKAT